MNKKDLINSIAARSGLKKVDVDLALTHLGNVAQAHLIRPGAELALPGIGKLKTVAKAARTGRNPKTGEALEIAARTAVKLVVAKELKDAAA